MKLTRFETGNSTNKVPITSKEEEDLQLLHRTPWN